MGGMALAARQLDMQVVVGVDSNATAVRTFGKNFPEAEAIEGSIRSPRIIDRCAELLRPSDDGVSIVVSGPPCQGFSVAGSRDPSDPRNQILLAVARGITTLAPDCALVENVSAVLAAEHAQRLKKFYDLLAVAKYYVTTLVLNASEFGVAQKRKRVFFFVLRRQVTPDEILKRLEFYKQPVTSVESAFHDLPSPPVRPADYCDERDYGGVLNHFAMCHSQRVIEKIAAIAPGTGPMSYRRLNATRPSNTLFSGHRAPPAHFSEPRSITVREAARLQGFPDDFRIYGTFGNQMEQVTNAVPPPLARAAIQVLAEVSGVLEQ
jgi:DNA (cytosine-5)-methyltransferase 1